MLHVFHEPHGVAHERLSRRKTVKQIGASRLQRRFVKLVQALSPLSGNGGSSQRTIGLSCLRPASCSRSVFPMPRRLSPIQPGFWQSVLRACCQQKIRNCGSGSGRDAEQTCHESRRCHGQRLSGHHPGLQKYMVPPKVVEWSTGMLPADCHVRFRLDLAEHAVKRIGGRSAYSLIKFGNSGAAFRSGPPASTKPRKRSPPWKAAGLETDMLERHGIARLPTMRISDMPEEDRGAAAFEAAGERPVGFQDVRWEISNCHYPIPPYICHLDLVMTLSGGCGGTGRRTRFRFWRREAWGFESLHPHQIA